MLFKLPKVDASEFKDMHKIKTYNLLANSGCNVLKSILITEKVKDRDVNIIKEYLSLDFFMLRYQYIKKAQYHRCGGNRYLISKENINCLWEENAYIWLMEEIDRKKNKYGINIMINRITNSIVIEIVGVGFDVSDINRGRLKPHEIVKTEYPIRWGYNFEIWKFMNINIISKEEYQKSVIYRKDVLRTLNADNKMNIFPEYYIPLSLQYFYQIYRDVNNIDKKIKFDQYCISCSIDEKGKLVYWDIQIPKEKMKLYMC